MEGFSIDKNLEHWYSMKEIMEYPFQKRFAFEAEEYIYIEVNTTANIVVIKKEKRYKYA